MIISSLNEKQKAVYNRVKECFTGSDVEVWFYTKNKLFRNRAPIDLLLTENYEYFTQFIEQAD